MPVEVVTVPCRSDNYAFLVHNTESDETALIDAPEAAPIGAALKARGWKLNDVLITHHHGDHVEGLGPLREAYAPRVIGCGADAGRLPALDLSVADGDEITVAGQKTIVQRCFWPHHQPYRVPHARLRARLHCGQPDGAGLRAGVRGYIRADVGQPVQAGGVASRNRGLFRPRVHANQRALCADH